METGNVIVLDEVTPRYLKASDAPNACSASLGIARDVLLDSGAALRRPLTARPGPASSNFLRCKRTDVATTVRALYPIIL